MTIARWDPFRELEDMNAHLNRMFGRSPTDRSAPPRDAMTAFDWAPTVDIAESPTEFHIKAELAGLKPEEVKVSVENGRLRIEGERKQEKEEKDKKWHRIERSYGSFHRSFSLPDNIDGDKVAAEFRDGVLHVTLPKRDGPKTRSVAVKAG